DMFRAHAAPAYGARIAWVASRRGSEAGPSGPGPRTSAAPAAPPRPRHTTTPPEGTSPRAGQNATGFILAYGRACLPQPMQEEPNMEQTSGFWADALGVAASPVAIAAGIVKGSYDAATGSGAFDDGFHEAADPIVASARKFGTEHRETITKG